MIYIVFFLLFNVEPINAQVACDLQNQGAFSDVMVAWTRPRYHPFYNACSNIDLKNGETLSAKSNQEKLPINIYLSHLPDKTLGGKDLKLFFDKIRLNIEAKIKEERGKINNLKNCLNTKSPNECVPIDENTKAALGIDNQTKYNFNDLIDDARFNLLLASPQNALWKVVSHKRILNNRLKGIGVYKAKGWAKPSQEELTIAQSQLNNYHEEGKKCGQSILNARKEYDRNPKIREKYVKSYTEKKKREAKEEKILISSGLMGEKTVPTKVVEFTKDLLFADTVDMEIPNAYNNIKEDVISNCMAQARYSHLAAYTSILASHPILQFIQNPKPSKKEVLNATNEMLNSLNKEEKWLVETTASVDSEGSLHKDVLKLLNYKTEVEKVLRSNPEYCGISRDLKHLADAKSMGMDLGMMFPVLIGSVFMPVSAVALLNFGTMAALTGKDHREFIESQYQVSGRFNPESTEELEELSLNAQARDMDAFFTAMVIPPLKLPIKNEKYYYRYRPRVGPKVIAPDIMEGEYRVIKSLKGPKANK